MVAAATTASAAPAAPTAAAAPTVAAAAAAPPLTREQQRCIAEQFPRALDRAFRGGFRNPGQWEALIRAAVADVTKTCFPATGGNPGTPPDIGVIA